MATFKEIKLSEVFDWIPNIKRLKPVDISRYTTGSTEVYPFYGQQLADNGVIGYISVDKRFLNNAEGKVYLLIASNNHSISIVTTPFFLKEDHAATSIIGHPRMTIQSALYIRGSIQKVFDTVFDYNAKALQGVLQSTTVSLPFMSEDSDELDWDYMNTYIERLKERSMGQIRQFIDRQGFGSSESAVLTDKDFKILEQRTETAYDKFKLGQLFDTIKRGRRIKSMDRVKGSLPFYTAGTEKFGFSSYIGNENAEVFPSGSLTIDMFGNTYYRGYRYSADDHVTVLYNSRQIYSKKILQYMQTQINSAIRGKFSYSRNFYPSDAYEVEIYLPVKGKPEPDFEFIENYMSVIEKKVMDKLLKRL